MLRLTVLTDTHRASDTPIDSIGPIVPAGVARAATIRVPLAPEFGLSLWLEFGNERILFDTGAGTAFLRNASALGIDLTSVTRVVLSHGHYDHTTGLAHLQFPEDCPVHVGPGIDVPCFSLHQDGEIHDISLPASTLETLKHHRVCVTEHFSEITDGVFLTGPMDRISGEDCGGKFYTDRDCTICNAICEEQALLTRTGTLVTGCCHAGIVNTVEACRKTRPEIPVKTIVGGLHLMHADTERLRHVAAYLNGLDLQRMILLHCTGSEASDYLKKHVNCDVLTGSVGSQYEID